MDATTAVVVIFTIVMAIILAGLVIWCTIQSHVHCVSEINKAWEGSIRFRDSAWARIVDERRLHAEERTKLSEQLAKQAEHSDKLTQAVVTLWEKGKVTSIG